MNDIYYLKYSNYILLIFLLLFSLIALVNSSNNDYDDFEPLALALISSALNISINDTDLTPFEDVDPTNPIFIFMCIVYTISTLTAILSNLLVLLVYKFGFSATTDLTLYLVNLAVADFLMSTVCMPFTFAQALLKKWYFSCFNYSPLTY
jgi:hypothetical protein